MGIKTSKTVRVVQFLRMAVVGILAVAALAGEAQAQEVQVTGPLAGAPAVRQLRLYRQSRFEIAPSVSFSLLDEYARQIYAGARLNYNFTDWLAIGAWGAFAASVRDTGLVNEIQDLNVVRRQENEVRRTAARLPTLNSRLTAQNLGQNFSDQLGTIDWIFTPQLTLVPFRGKISIFQGIFADTDFYFFGGPAFVGLTERADCAGPQCVPPGIEYDANVVDANGVPTGAVVRTTIPNTYTFPTASRTAVTGTFGLGLTFYLGSWAGLGLEWRGLPLARNTGGFDNRGGGPDGDFPDRSIDGDDRQFKFGQLLSVSFNIYLPFQNRVSQ